MRQILCLFSLLIPLIGIGSLNAQNVLFADDFNNCSLAPGWQVSSTGNPAIVWYVDVAQNDLVQGQSIDNTCFLMIDDYLTGPGTPGYVLNFASPAFNVQPYTTVQLSMNVHFRAGGNDYLEIRVHDGTKETLLARYDQNMSNGDFISDYFSLQYDLSTVSQSANTRIIMRYVSPTGSNGFYAGIDNVSVVGSGGSGGGGSGGSGGSGGTPPNPKVIQETFDNCAMPAGWTMEILNGNDGWKFGKVPTGTSASFAGTSMDGSCFVYFNDIEFEDTQSSATRLYSPWFDGTDFYHYDLDFDAIMRYNGGEVLAVYLQNGSADELVLYKSEGHVGGPYLPEYVHINIDLTPYRSSQMRLVFEYDDNGIWGYWAGLDNIRVTGKDQAFDFCSHAMSLQTGAACHPINNTTALFDGPAATCSGRTTANLWYNWEADFSGVAKLITNADFNDVVSIFSGSCGSLTPEFCDNHDEHGFTGETTYFNVQAGKTYFIRVSGLDEGFGTARGNLCVQISQAGSTPTPPNNDNCANAVGLNINAACTNGSNVDALTSATLPTLNQLARADVWYRFTAAALNPGEVYEVQSNASFSDIITVYKGGCSTLQEVAGNHNGGTLELPGLTNGETYYIQIAGNFATVEGSLCARVVAKQTQAPQNDDCLAAIPVALDGACVPGSNQNAGFSGFQPSCAVSVDRDIWFKFVAPSFGSVHVNTGALFEHTLALWEGDCNNLKPVFCTANPLRCSGYVTAGNLNEGQTYYLQISSLNGAAGSDAGNVCVRILNGKTSPAFQPLDLQVKATCIATDTAKLTVKVAGGTPPYTFPANTPGQVLPSGTPYTVVVVDSTGCEHYAGGVVRPCASNDCTQEILFTPSHPLCFGETDGAIYTDLTGGTAPFYFYWSNNVYTADNLGLTAGAYTLTVVDANGCESVFSQTLVQPDSIRITQDNIQYPTQGQNNGAIQVTVSGGSGSYTYEWLVNGNPFSGGVEDLSGLRKGIYTLIATDGAGCQKVFTVNLPETVGTKFRVAPSVALVVPNPARDRAQLAVSFSQPRGVQLSITDAMGQILRSWSAEHVKEQSLPIDLSHLPAGVYSLWVQAAEESFVRKIIVGY